jgi:hypothetical protein
MNDAILHCALAAVRVVLVRAGCTPSLLADLVAPRRRRRVKNSETGKYRFVLVRK